MTVDMSRYLALFLAESTEHLDALSKDLAGLEAQPKDRVLDYINGLFRHAHSLKGMAASMGYESTATIAHRLEDLLSALRDDVTRIDRTVVDLMLQAVDAAMAHVKAAAESRAFPDVRQTLTQMAAKLSQLTGQAPEPTRVAQWALAEQRRAQEAVLGPRLEVKARISARCPTPGVRGFLVYKRMSTLGNVFALVPALDLVKAGKIPDGLISLELETQAPKEQVTQLLSTIADVEVVTVRSLGNESAPAAEPEGPKPVGQEPLRTVRVKTELLDQFMDLAGELLLATARVRETARAMPVTARGGLLESVDQVHSLTRSLHQKVMKARMTPLSAITDRLPRASRDIARRRSRECELIITGAEIELDRGTVDELNEPLLHLLRNAIDHGIEGPEDRLRARKPVKGKVNVTVTRERDRVVLEVADDGRGMDVEKLKALATERGLLTLEQAESLSRHDALMLCCLPGISTAGDVTEVSGRGVGMDAVKRAVEAAGGHLEIISVTGEGTKIRALLPLTLAVVTLLLVGVGDEVLGLPITKVLAVVEERPDRLSSTHAEALLLVGGSWVPVRVLAELLDLPAASPPQALRPYVVVESDAGNVALEIDKLVGQEEVVLKALQRPLDLVVGLAGVSILGSGRPVFVLDVPKLAGGT